MEHGMPRSLNALFSEHVLAPPQPKTLVSNVYQVLRRDIIEGKHPPGMKLRVEHLKDSYNVGTGTLREALAMLATDALVTVQDQRGFRVAPISIGDFYDITETRVLLECNAIRSTIRHGDDAWEGSLTSAFHVLTLAEQRLRSGGDEMFNAWEAANQRFHQVLIAHCQSRWIQHFLGILYSQAERYRRLLLVNRPVSRDVHAEHRAIFDAAIARDEEEAARLLAGHIRYNYRLLTELSADSKNAVAPTPAVTNHDSATHLKTHPGV
jgi:DNA-binding GntR family transcriptional regulator